MEKYIKINDALIKFLKENKTEYEEIEIENKDYSKEIEELENLKRERENDKKIIEEYRELFNSKKADEPKKEIKFESTYIRKLKNEKPN